MTSHYSHTQKGIIQPLLIVVAVVCLTIGYSQRNEPDQLPIFVIAAVVSVLVSLFFAQLTVRDEGNQLYVGFGHIPLFRQRIPYTTMVNAQRDKSTFIQGWGIHHTRRGWLWNIGGFDCVRIELGNKSILVGTDDPDRLVSFLLTKINNS